MKEGDTYPKLVMRNYEKYGGKKVAMRRKDFGYWIEHTWGDYYSRVKYFALGLASLDFEHWYSTRRKLH